MNTFQLPGIHLYTTLLSEQASGEQKAELAICFIGERCFIQMAFCTEKFPKPASRIGYF